MLSEIMEEPGPTRIKMADLKESPDIDALLGDNSPYYRLQSEPLNSLHVQTKRTGLLNEFGTKSKNASPVKIINDLVGDNQSLEDDEGNADLNGPPETYFGSPAGRRQSTHQMKFGLTGQSASKQRTSILAAREMAIASDKKIQSQASPAKYSRRMTEGPQQLSLKAKEFQSTGLKF